MDSIGRLFEAAQEGDASELHALLAKDKLILARSSLATIADTALHVATLAGKLNFVKELLILKPELATRLNRDGFGPIHMASANGYTDIVREMLKSEKETARLRCGDGRIALHFAVTAGSIDVIRELLTTCPECKSELTDYQENVFHLAVKNCQFESFRVLLQMFRDIDEGGMKEMLNGQDCDGNTVLHLATSRKLQRIVKVLLGMDDTIAIDKVEVNLRNNKNLTALDMLDEPTQQTTGEQVAKTIREMLQNGGEVGNQNTKVCFHCLPQRLSAHLCKEIFSVWLDLKKEVNNSTSETRSAVMVVAVLIATVTFQAVLSPPAGYQQFQQSGGNEAQDQHSKGMAVMASDTLIFIIIMMLNIVGFFSSIIMIWMLINQFPLKNLLRLAVLATSSSFLISIFYIGPFKVDIIYILTLLMAAIVMLQVFGFMFWLAQRHVDFRSCCGAPLTDTNSSV